MAFSVSVLAGLDGFSFSLFLPVIVLPPCGKEAFIPGLGFGISSGCVLVHLLSGNFYCLRLMRPLPCQFCRRSRIGFSAGFQILQGRLFPVAVALLCEASHKWGYVGQRKMQSDLGKRPKLAQIHKIALHNSTVTGHSVVSCLSQFMRSWFAVHDVSSRTGEDNSPCRSSSIFRFISTLILAYTSVVFRSACPKRCLIC